MKFIYLIIYNDKWFRYFYKKVNKGSGLRIVENKSGNGIKLVKGGGCNMKSKQIGK